MSRVFTGVLQPTWTRISLRHQSGLLYKNLFVSDAAMRHIREHAIYGPAEKGNSHFFLNTEKLNAMKDILSVHDSLFRYTDQKYKLSNIAILGNLARVADIKSGIAIDGRVIREFMQKDGKIVLDTTLHYDAHIGTGPIKVKGQDITAHGHTSDLRVVTGPRFITEEQHELFQVVTAFPIVKNPQRTTPHAV